LHSLRLEGICAKSASDLLGEWPRGIDPHITLPNVIVVLVIEAEKQRVVAVL
jgi:hypothetical protein